VPRACGIEGLPGLEHPEQGAAEFYDGRIQQAPWHLGAKDQAQMTQIRSDHSPHGAPQRRWFECHVRIGEQKKCAACLIRAELESMSFPEPSPGQFRYVKDLEARVGSGQGVQQIAGPVRGPVIDYDDLEVWVVEPENRRERPLDGPLFVAGRHDDAHPGQVGSSKTWDLLQIFHQVKTPPDFQGNPRGEYQRGNGDNEGEVHPIAFRASASLIAGIEDIITVVGKGSVALPPYTIPPRQPMRPDNTVASAAGSFAAPGSIIS